MVRHRDQCSAIPYTPEEFAQEAKRSYEAGAAVIGVSGDSAARHQAFASNHRLPFVLVSDSDGKARRAFGVPKALGILPGRVTYVIDKEGIVRHVFRSQFAADRHVKEALEVVRSLNA